MNHLYYVLLVLIPVVFIAACDGMATKKGAAISTQQVGNSASTAADSSNATASSTATPTATTTADSATSTASAPAATTTPSVNQMSQTGGVASSMPDFSQWLQTLSSASSGAASKTTGDSGTTDFSKMLSSMMTSGNYTQIANELSSPSTVSQLEQAGQASGFTKGNVDSIISTLKSQMAANGITTATHSSSLALTGTRITAQPATAVATIAADFAKILSITTDSSDSTYSVITITVLNQFIASLYLPANIDLSAKYNLVLSTQFAELKSSNPAALKELISAPAILLDLSAAEGNIVLAMLQYVKNYLPLNQVMFMTSIQ